MRDKRQNEKIWKNEQWILPNVYNTLRHILKRKNKNIALEPLNDNKKPNVYIVRVPKRK